MLPRQNYEQTAEIHSPIIARHRFLQQGSAEVPLLLSKEEEAVTAEGDEEVCPGGPAVHSREAWAPAGHGGSHSDVAEPQESKDAVSSPTRLRQRQGKLDVRRR